MDGTPEMQEHFPAMSMDGRYAGNAGAISGDVHGGRYAGKCRSNFPASPWIPSALEVPEHFRHLFMTAGMPEISGTIAR